MTVWYGRAWIRGLGGEEFSLVQYFSKAAFWTPDKKDSDRIDKRDSALSGGFTSNSSTFPGITVPG